MKLLIFGDIFGRIGRKSFLSELPKLKEKFNPDFIIVNVDNLSSGRGPIEKHILELEEAGVDIMMGGDHIFDNYEKIKNYLDKEDSKLLRFANYYLPDTIGQGYKVFEKDGQKLLAIHLQGQAFMRDDVYNPFLKAEEIIEELKNENLDGIIVDFHRETTAELQGLAHLLDSKVSLVYGTHTHVQTNDELILPGGTGMISDVGMSGGLYGVIGAEFDSVKNRFLAGTKTGKIIPYESSEYMINGIFVEIENNKCKTIEKIKIIKK